MSKTVSTLAIVAALGAQAASAQAAEAASKVYVQGGASVVRVEDENFGVLNATAGYAFNRHVAVEGETAFGVQDKKIDGIKAKVDYTLGAYVVGSLPVSENVDLIGRVGAVKGQIKVKLNNNISASLDDSSVAYGVGVRYFPNGGLNGLRADLTKYDFDDADVKAVQVSYVRRF